MVSNNERRRENQPRIPNQVHNGTTYTCYERKYLSIWEHLLDTTNWNHNGYPYCRHLHKPLLRLERKSKTHPKI